MAASEKDKKAVLLLDLGNIEQSVRRLREEVTSDSFTWDEELYSKVRDLREEIIYL